MFDGLDTAFYLAIGAAVYGAATVSIIVLRAAGQLDWAWAWALLPIWGPVACIVLGYGAGAVLYFIKQLLRPWLT